jgi:hypothetical protein
MEDSAVHGYAAKIIPFVIPGEARRLSRLGSHRKRKRDSSLGSE